jgi:hypothetical protein
MEINGMSKAHPPVILRKDFDLAQALELWYKIAGPN